MEQPQQQPTLLPPEEMREEQQQQQQPAEEAEGAPAAEQKQQPTSLGFLQLQDAFKRMVAVGVDVVDQGVSRRGRSAAASRSARCAPQRRCAQREGRQRNEPTPSPPLSTSP